MQNMRSLASTDKKHCLILLSIFTYIFYLFTHLSSELQLVYTAFILKKQNRLNNDYTLWETKSFGLGMTLSYVSLLGPIKLNVSKASDLDEYLIQFSLGYRFD